MAICKDRTQEYEKISMYVEKDKDNICNLFEIIDNDENQEITLENIKLNFSNNIVKVTQKIGDKETYIEYLYKDNQLIQTDNKGWNYTKVIAILYFATIINLLFGIIIKFVL